MKVWTIPAFMVLVLIFPFYAIGSNFEDDSTPIEQQDVKTIGQIDEKSSLEEESTPIEDNDTKPIDQDDDNEHFFENDSTPIEQEDIKSIDQIND